MDGHFPLACAAPALAPEGHSVSCTPCPHGHCSPLGNSMVYAHFVPRLATCEKSVLMTSSRVDRDASATQTPRLEVWSHVRGSRRSWRVCCGIRADFLDVDAPSAGRCLRRLSAAGQSKCVRTDLRATQCAAAHTSRLRAGTGVRRHTPPDKRPSRGRARCLKRQGSSELGPAA